MEFKDFFTFEKFVTPKWITLLYWIGLFFIVVWAVKIAGFFGVLESGYGGYGGDVSASGIVLGLLYALIGAFFWRVFCEIWVVVFSINDRLGALVELAEKSGTGTDRNLRR